MPVEVWDRVRKPRTPSPECGMPGRKSAGDTGVKQHQEAGRSLQDLSLVLMDQ